MVIVVQTNVFSSIQVCVGLLRVKTSHEVSLLHSKDPTPRNAHDFPPMPESIKYPVRQEAVDFVQGRH